MSKTLENSERHLVDHIHIEELGQPSESYWWRLFWIMISALMMCATALIFNWLSSAPMHGASAAEVDPFDQWVAPNHQSGLVLHQERDKAMPLFVGERGYTLKPINSTADAIIGELICSSHGHRVGRFELSFTVRNRLSLALHFDDGAIQQIELEAAK